MPAVESNPDQIVIAEAERVLRQNWREGARGELRYSYTEPSPGRYPWQWYWDSCFAAIAWKPVTCPSTRQGVTSTLLTILPGQEAGGVSAV